MKTFFFILLVSLSSEGAGASSAPAPSPRLLTVSPGRSVRVAAQATGEIHLANGRVAKIEDQGDALVITGKKVGITSMTVGRTAYEIHVVPADAETLDGAFGPFLNQSMGLRIDWDESKLVISGELLRFEDWLRLAELSRGRAYLFRASVEGTVRQEALEHFNKLISQNHLPAPSLNLDGEARLGVPAGPTGLQKSFARVFAPFGFKIETDDRLVSLEPMVEVSILVAEVRRKSFDKMGLQWPGSYTAKILPKFEAGAAAELSLQALEEKGLGKILASPKLLCRSGKEAQFLAGGEFPIKIMNFKINDVIWKKHGVILKIKPLVDLEGHMSIALETEVSMIDTSQVVDGVPGLLTNRIESHFDLERSETIALSGLIKKEWGRSHGGLPGLSSLPILGLLFGSEDYRENRTELVVFVTPKVVPVKGLGHPVDMPEEWNAKR